MSDLGRQGTEKSLSICCCGVQFKPFQVLIFNKFFAIVGRGSHYKYGLFM